MRNIDLNEDIIFALVDLAERAGARDIAIGYLHDDVPPEQAGWYAHVAYRGARITTDEHASPSGAALALAERLLAGATCRCRRPVTLTDRAEGCRWRLTGRRWEPGCTAPSVRIPTGTERGDHAALYRALHGDDQP